MPYEILSTPPNCEIVSSRIVEAPQSLVFTAWTNPDHLKKWWGPAGFTNSFHQFDLRPGGKWRYTMHGPEQGHYENECEFIRIDSPHLLAWQRISKPIFQVVAQFEDAGERRTRIIFKMLFNSAGECEKLKKFVVDKNEENFDRLENELLTMI